MCSLRIGERSLSAVPATNTRCSRIMCVCVRNRSRARARKTRLSRVRITIIVLYIHPEYKGLFEMGYKYIYIGEGCASAPSGVPYEGARGPCLARVCA